MRKGFTLVELLGVIVILAIVLGLAVAGYLGLNGEIDKIYYRSVEESMVIPGSDYFTYNKGEQPSIFGDEVKVTAKKLQEGGYLENELVDSDGESCDLENSYVGAYKDSKDKTNYYTCLSCGEYSTEDSPCTGGANYSLGIKANGKNTKDVYDIKVGKWTNENIVLTFETLNDMKNVILEDSSNRQVGSCELKTKNKVKTCTIEVANSDNYKAYAKSGNVTTRKEEVKIQIDKTPPTFDIVNTGTGNKIEIEIGSNPSIAVSNEVRNINDPESKVKMIEYSFEKTGQKAKYQAVGLTNSFKIDKTLELATYDLIVRVTNNAGGVTSKKVVYEIYRKIDKPTAEGYCQTELAYNGVNQTLTKGAPEGITFSNNIQKDAGKYQVTAKLKSNYRYKDNTTSDIKFECGINKKEVEVRWSIGEYIYNGTSQGPSASGSGASGETLNITTTKEINAGDYTSKATLTSVSGGQKNINNYELTNTSANYTIKKADPNLVLSSYSGEIKAAEKVDVTASTDVSGKYTNTTSNTNASVAPSSGSGTGETITITGKISGSCDITVKFVPTNNNYETVSKTYKLTVTTVKYTINYWQMNNDGTNYTLVKTVTGEGNVGSRVTGERITYNNFETPDPITITLDADASKNVIDYFYDKACFGATCDFCKRGTPLGKCLYDNQESLKLKSTGLDMDTSKQIIRYVGASWDPVNNYICFGNNCGISNDVHVHRIIGVFTDKHQVRVINTSRWGFTYYNGSSNNDIRYGVSNLKKVVDNVVNNIMYQSPLNGSGTTKYADLLAPFGLCGNSHSGASTAERFLNNEHSNYDGCWSSDRKINRYETVYMSPTWISDYLLSYNGTDIGVAKNGIPSDTSVVYSWLHFPKDEWSFLWWNSSHAWYMEGNGYVCNNNTSATTKCESDGGYFAKSRTKGYRVTFQLDENVLFCGGSGTNDDPYIVGWGNCTN